jgi:hypothetical protein
VKVCIEFRWLKAGAMVGFLIITLTNIRVPHKQEIFLEPRETKLGLFKNWLCGRDDESIHRLVGYLISKFYCQ